MIQWQIQVAGISKSHFSLSLILSSTTVVRKVKYSVFPVFPVVRHGHEVMFCPSICRQKLVQEISGKTFAFLIKRDSRNYMVLPPSCLSKCRCTASSCGSHPVTIRQRTTGLQRRQHCYHQPLSQSQEPSTSSFLTMVEKVSLYFTQVTVSQEFQYFNS